MERVRKSGAKGQEGKGGWFASQQATNGYLSPCSSFCGMPGGGELGPVRKGGRGEHQTLTQNKRNLRGIQRRRSLSVGGDKKARLGLQKKIKKK